MGYPNAYCVKCGKQTPTLQKHTVVLESKARALRGVCRDCEADVYRILPKDRDYKTLLEQSPNQKSYPNAYCVRCRDHTPTDGAHTVYLENDSRSRAMTGTCRHCGTEVYRILGYKNEGGPNEGRDERKVSGGASLSVVQPQAAPQNYAQAQMRSAQRPSNGYALWVAGGLIVGIIAGFMLVSIF